MSGTRLSIWHEGGSQPLVIESDASNETIRRNIDFANKSFMIEFEDRKLNLVHYIPMACIQRIDVEEIA